MPPGRSYVDTNVARKNCDMAGDVPKMEHFAILEFTSIFIPGDERSRTNPGHGYPESTRKIVNYISFTVQGQWEADIRRRVERKDTNFVAIRSTPVKIDVNVSINIS